MLVTVLMPAYNAEKYVEEAVRSVLEQTYGSFELLICNDGSGDNTLSIVESIVDSRIQVFSNQANLGKAETCNFLWSRANGELVTIHDADDVSRSDRFEKMVALFRSNPSVYMAGHIVQRMTAEGKKLNLFRDKVTDFSTIKSMMEYQNTDGDPSIFIRREVIPEIGGLLRPYFKNNMDYDLALRVIEKYETTNLPEVLSYYRNVPNSISKGINSHHKLVTPHITRFFYRERLETGSDMLMRGERDKIAELEWRFSEPYRSDATLYLREMSAFFMYVQMNGTAINYAWRAVCGQPGRLVNWLTLQYCIRKTLLGV